MISITYSLVKDKLVENSKNGVLDKVHATGIGKYSDEEKFEFYKEIFLDELNEKPINPSELRDVVEKIRCDFYSEPNVEENTYINILSFLSTASMNLQAQARSYEPEESYEQEGFYEPEESYEPEGSYEQEGFYEPEGSYEPEESYEQEGSHEQEEKSSQMIQTNNKKLDEKEIYVKVMKKLVPFLKYSVLGASVGLGASIIIPSVGVSMLGGIRITYSIGKCANKIWSKKFLKGQPTPIDKVIDLGKEKLKSFAKKSLKDSYEKWALKAKKVSLFLKKREVQWFLNGMAAGYVVGNYYDLNGKIFNNNLRSSLQNNLNSATLSDQNSPISRTVNDPYDLNVERQLKNGPSLTRSNKLLNSESATNIGNQFSTDIEWLKTGENIDLSMVKEGFRDSLNAMTNKNSVGLLTEYATKGNGTFIKAFKLPNGEMFTGSIGDLISQGFDPSEISARVMNQNGDYAWLNVQDILNAYQNTIGKAR